MPLAYFEGKTVVTGALTKEAQNFITTVKTMMNQSGTDNDNEEYDIAIRIGVSFQKSKSNSFEGAPVQYDKTGTPIMLSEEDIRNRFPLTYKNVTDKARSRYSDFKQGREFNKIMDEIKTEGKLCHVRKLDPNNPKSTKQTFYSSNIWQKLDQHYSRN